MKKQRKYIVIILTHTKRKLSGTGLCDIGLLLGLYNSVLGRGLELTRRCIPKDNNFACQARIQMICEKNRSSKLTFAIAQTVRDFMTIN